MSRDNRTANISSESTSDAEFIKALREARQLGRRLGWKAQEHYKAVMKPARAEQNSIELQAGIDSRKARENASLRQKARLESAKEQMLQRAANLEKLHHVVIEKTEGQATWKRVVSAAVSLESRATKWNALQKESLAATFAAILQPVYESMNVEIEAAKQEYESALSAAQAAYWKSVQDSGRALGKFRNRTRHEGKAGRQAVWHRYLVHGNVHQLLAEMRELTTP
jgi:hypothetical protein